MADLIIEPAPSPPSAPGIPQPVIIPEDGNRAFFPAFTPIIPPPLIGEGGGPPPPFPPPTPEPIGEVPVGPLVGPVVAAAGVPPSVAGFEQPQFATGSATSPPGYFPAFTAPLPTPPPIDFINILMIGDAVPPQKQTEEAILLDGWGPSVPPGAPTEPGPDGRFPRPQLPITVEAVARANAKPRRARRKEV